MNENPAIAGSSHPAPHRERAPFPALAFGLFAAPLAWAAHLLLNYSIAGHSCVGAAIPDFRVGSTRVEFTSILLIDLCAIALAIAAGYVAYCLWERTKEEKGGDMHHLVHAGEGRTRFLAMCGMLTSLLFGLAVLIDALGAMVGPPC